MDAFKQLGSLFILLALALFQLSSAQESCAPKPLTPAEGIINSEINSLQTRSRSFKKSFDKVLTEYYVQLDPAYRILEAQGHKSAHNLTTWAAVELTDLARERNEWLSFYYRINPDQVELRMRIIEKVLAPIDVYREVLKRSMERFEYYRNQSEEYRSRDALDYNELKEKIEEITLELYGNNYEYEWKKKFTTEWKRFRCDPSQNGTLREHLRRVKQALERNKRNAAALWDPVPKDMSKYLSPGTEQMMLELVVKIDWVERLVNEYLGWMQSGRRPLPDGTNCTQPRLVESAFLAREQMNHIMANFLLDEERISPENEVVVEGADTRVRNEIQTLNRTIQERYLPELEALHNQLIEKRSQIPKENFHDKFEIIKTMEQVHAFMQYLNKFVLRSHFYSRQSRAFFRWSHNPNHVPIERGLEEIDDRFEQLARERTGGCLFWTEQLESLINHNSNSNSDSAQLKETLELFREKALEAKRKIDELMALVPDDRSWYLRPQTEISLLTQYKFYTRVLTLCEEYSTCVKMP